MTVGLSDKNILRSKNDGILLKKKNKKIKYHIYC